MGQAEVHDAVTTMVSSEPDDPAAGYATPEEAAVADWPVAANPRVLAVRRRDADVVEVTIDTEPSHPMTVRCRRVGTRWFITDEWTA